VIVVPFQGSEGAIVDALKKWFEVKDSSNVPSWCLTFDDGQRRKRSIL